jgi:hypothetical protein
MQRHGALTAGIPWSSQVQGTVRLLVLTLKAQLNKRVVMTRKVTGTRKESSEGLTDNVD